MILNFYRQVGKDLLNHSHRNK